MRSAIVVALLAAATLGEAAAHARRASSSACNKHRRHHHKSKQGAATPVNAGKTSRVSTTTKPKPKASPPAANTSSNGLSGISKDNVFLGFLPDEGDAGGTRETMAQLDQMLKGKAATYGWYAQAQSGTTFDGSQLLAVMNDVKSSGAIFEAAVMPTGGWQGLTSDDNSQAVAICNVMKQFTDQGIETRLRFAHEVNYYQTDGTYTGGVSDFQEGWATVAAACKKIAPNVQMFFTPNVANMNQYKQYYPTDASTVDLCGIDFYPQDISDPNTFVNAMQQFHDFCTSNGKTKFAIGETGLGFAGSPQQRVQWLNQIMSSKSKLPNLLSVSWFNFQKGYDFRLLDSVGGSATTATLNYLA